MKKYVLVVIENCDELDGNVFIYDTLEKAQAMLNESYQYVKGCEDCEILEDYKDNVSYYIKQEDLNDFTMYEAKARILEKEV